MPLPLGAIILAGATAGFGHFFQKTAANNRREHDKRAAELARAEKIFKEISDSISKLHSDFNFYLNAAFLAENSEKLPKFDEKNYREWHEKAPRYRGIIRATFGNEIAQSFEKINDDAKKCYDYIILLTIIQSPDEKLHLARFEGFMAAVPALLDHMTEIINQMLQQIQDQNVGGLRLEY